MTTPAFQKYQQMVTDTDRLTTDIETRFSNQITCHQGCSGCCQQHLSLSPIEAVSVQQAVQSLSPEQQQTVKQAAQKLLDGHKSPCPLLIDDTCSIYAHRPIICRTHGCPITFQEEDDDGIFLDVCPLNFSEDGELEKLELSDTVPIDRVNLRLAAINYVYCRDELGDTGETTRRISMADIITHALD